MKQVLLKTILSTKLYIWLVHFDYNPFGHTSNTILNVNFCPKEFKITNENKNGWKLYDQQNFFLATFNLHIDCLVRLSEKWDIFSHLFNMFNLIFTLFFLYLPHSSTFTPLHIYIFSLSLKWRWSTSPLGVGGGGGGTYFPIYSWSQPPPASMGARGCSSPTDRSTKSLEHNSKGRIRWQFITMAIGNRPRRRHSVYSLRQQLFMNK
jgi:hypothetical protein